MDLETQSEAVLREANFDTWQINIADKSIVCFEDGSLMGFLCTFPTVDHLLRDWEKTEFTILDRHQFMLRQAGDKAWNVYSCYLTTETPIPTQRRPLSSIDEDLHRTRKIARAGIVTLDDLKHALAPILPIENSQQNFPNDLEHRLRQKLDGYPAGALDKFFADADALEIARALGELD